MMQIGVGLRCQVVISGVVRRRAGVVGPASPGEHWCVPGVGPCLIGNLS
jgi:hypothetical protein